MTEEDARDWLAARGWMSGRTGALLGKMAGLLVDENTRQNLIASSTLPNLWSRHIVDSAQLITLTGDVSSGLWVDLGSGGGFPGLIIAVLRDAPIVLVETRGLRVKFLEHCISELNLAHAQVVHGRVEKVHFSAPAAWISARAFASLHATFDVAHHLCDRNTAWILPKGKSAQKELENASQEWQAVFHVEQSITDSESAIIVASDVRRLDALTPAKSARSRKA